MLAFEYPIRPFTFGPRSSPFFAMPYLAVGGVGPWAWVGVAGRWAPRNAAPAVVGRFIFFRDLAFFGDSEDSGFGDTDDGDGRRNRFFEQKIAKIYRQFFWRFKQKYLRKEETQ